MYGAGGLEICFFGYERRCWGGISIPDADADTFLIFTNHGVGFKKQGGDIVCVFSAEKLDEMVGCFLIVLAEMLDGQVHMDGSGRFSMNNNFVDTRGKIKKIEPIRYPRHQPSSSSSNPYLVLYHVLAVAPYSLPHIT